MGAPEEEITLRLFREAWLQGLEGEAALGVLTYRAVAIGLKCDLCKSTLTAERAKRRDIYPDESVGLRLQVMYVCDYGHRQTETIELS